MSRYTVGLAAVAEVYDEAIANGYPPTKSVAEAFGLTPSVAAKRVMAARQHGLLPPVAKGGRRGNVEPVPCPTCGAWPGTTANRKVPYVRKAGA